MTTFIIVDRNGRDVGEGPWTDRAEAERFLEAEVGAAEARVIQILRRYVEWLEEPVGDFAEDGAGWYVLEDQNMGNGIAYGVIVDGPYTSEEEASAACERMGAGRDNASEEYLSKWED